MSSYKRLRAISPIPNTAQDIADQQGIIITDTDHPDHAPSHHGFHLPCLHNHPSPLPGKRMPKTV